MAATTLAPPRTAPDEPTARHDWRSRYFTWFCASVLVVFAAVWLIPLLWALITSFKTEGDVTVDPTSWWPHHWTLGAYRSILSQGNITDWYLNSLLIAVVNVVLTVIVASMAGMAISQTRFRGRRIIFMVIAAGLFIPPQVLILPLFSEFNLVHGLNTYWAVALPAVPTSVAVFIFASFFSGIPTELRDSAHMDGAGWLRIYRQIYMPLTRPAVSAVAIFTFVWSWNNFLWPLLVMTNPRTMTLPVGLSQVSSAYGIQYAQLMASAVLGALPLLVVFLLFQRRIVEGVATTGLK
jgi:multiple sugar transport system permease protein